MKDAVFVSNSKFQSKPSKSKTTHHSPREWFEHRPVGHDGRRHRAPRRKPNVGGGRGFNGRCCDRRRGGGGDRGRYPRSNAAAAAYRGESCDGGGGRVDGRCGRGRRHRRRRRGRVHHCGRGRRVRSGRNGRWRRQRGGGRRRGSATADRGRRRGQVWNGEEARDTWQGREGRERRRWQPSKNSPLYDCAPRYKIAVSDAKLL